MKTLLPRLFLATALVAFCVVCMLPISVFSQSPPPDSSPLISADTAGAVATPLVAGLALKYPVILTILAVMGTLRFFAKPIVSMVEAYVKSTADDAAMFKVEASLPFKWACWLLDFFASVKIGTQFTAKPQA